MLSPDAKEIWKSKAGASLMAAMLGSKPMDDADKATAAKLMTGPQLDAELDEPKDPK